MSKILLKDISKMKEREGPAQQYDPCNTNLMFKQLLADCELMNSNLQIEKQNIMHGVSQGARQQTNAVGASLADKNKREYSFG